MNTQELIPAVEAMLFAGGEPVELARLAQALETTPDGIRQAVDALRRRMAAQNSGLEIVTLEDGVQMVSKARYAEPVRKLFEIKRSIPLSQAAFEVLSVIAYHQPVTKAYVEQVRGVDCSGVIASLVAKGLIAERGRLDLPGRPLIYGTTDVFLRCFSFSSLADLPPVPEAEKEPGRFENGADAQRDVVETKMEDFVTEEA